MSFLLFVPIFILAAPVKEKDLEPNSAPRFEMVVTGESPYPLNDRNDLSLNTGGGKGVLISPRWVLTASHCITSSKQKAGKVNVRFTVSRQGSANWHDKVIRHKTKDIALLRLVRPVKPKERKPVLLLRQTMLGKVSMKKVAGGMTWRNIPAVGKRTISWYRTRKHAEAKLAPVEVLG